MELYLQFFLNFEWDDWPRLVAIVEFAYKNVYNASTGCIYFELNCDYDPWVDILQSKYGLGL